VRELSLLETFEQAPELQGLAGELPTQQQAIFRVLLAVAHSALPRASTNAERALAEWGEWWQAGSIPFDPIRAYLERPDIAQRFDLFHPETPFFQVADLHTASGGTSGLAKLIADVPAGHPYFTTRAGAEVTSLSIAEAARWLVHAQMYDTSGIKTGSVGDDRVKGGRGYPQGIAWAGVLGIVFAESTNLGRTLLLNLIRCPDRPEADTPVWERTQPGPGTEVEQQPRGPVDLLVRQTRRVRLIRDGDRVVDAVLSYGDPLQPHNQHQFEQFSAWKRSTNLEAKAGKGSTVYWPVQHQPDRALWRGFSAMLSAAPRTVGTQEAYLAPQLLDWLALLRSDEALPSTEPIRMHAIGMEYVNNQSVVGSIIDDVVAVPVGVLTDVHLRSAASTAVTIADGGVRALRDLARDLATAEGSDPAGAGDRATELGYHILDGPYRDWVAHDLPTQGASDAGSAWIDRVRGLILHAGDGLARAAPRTAWIGREVIPRNGKPHHLDTGTAWRYFLIALNKVLPRQRPTTAADDSSRATDPDDGATP